MLNQQQSFNAIEQSHSGGAVTQKDMHHLSMNTMNTVA